MQAMKLKSFSAFVLFLSLCAPVTWAQSSSTPSSLTIQQHFLEIEQAGLTREFKVVQRCIAQANRNLRDPRGNINRFRQIDLKLCGRRLQQLQRRLASLQRKGTRLSAQAKAQVAMLRSLQLQLQQMQE